MHNSLVHSNESVCRKSRRLGLEQVSIGYKYNAQKVFSFIVAEDAGRTKVGLPYLSKYSYQFSKVSILPLTLPLVVYKFFGSINEFGSHKKSKQSDLALEKFWVTRCGWIRLRTTVAVGMTITNLWKIFRCGVNRDHYDKSIGIRYFSELLALDCFNDPFSTDTGTP